MVKLTLILLLGLIHLPETSKAYPHCNHHSIILTVSQTAKTTRYWDCCKPSCGWPGKAFVTRPVESCARNGVRVVDTNTQSGCNGGSAYMCTDQQPWSVNDNLSYGFAAANIKVNEREQSKSVDENT